MTELRTSEAIRANIEALAEQQHQERAAAEAARAEQRAKATMLHTLTKAQRKAWNELGDTAKLADRAAEALTVSIADEQEALRDAVAREISHRLREAVTLRPDFDAAMRKIAENAHRAMQELEAEADSYDAKFFEAWSRAYRPTETTAAHLSRHGIAADHDTMTQPRIIINGQGHRRIDFWASGETLERAYTEVAHEAERAKAEASKPSPEDELAALRAKVDEARSMGQWLPEHIINQVYPPNPEPVYPPSKFARVMKERQAFAQV